MDYHNEAKFGGLCRKRAQKCKIYDLVMEKKGQTDIKALFVITPYNSSPNSPSKTDSSTYQDLVTDCGLKK